MPSANALTLVNRVLLTTGDFNQLTTIVGSPAAIGERIVSFLNLAVSDISRVMDFPILENVFSATGDGINSKWGTAIGSAGAANSVISCNVDLNKLEYVSPAQMVAYRNQLYVGLPKFFTTSVVPTGELEVDIYPTPAAGSSISIIGYNDPAQFTNVDTSTTEFTGMDDVILLGALQHMDAYDGMNRGYAKLYADAKNKLLVHHNRNKQIRIMPESYT